MKHTIIQWLQAPYFYFLVLQLPGVRVEKQVNAQIPSWNASKAFSGRIQTQHEDGMREWGTALTQIPCPVNIDLLPFTVFLSNKMRKLH